jgi:hypothetical protein
MEAAPDVAYGTSMGSRYQRQYLALGRQFKAGPTAVMADHAGELQLFGRNPLRLERIESDPDHVPMRLEAS